MIANDMLNEEIHNMVTDVVGNVVENIDSDIG